MKFFKVSLLCCVLSGLSAMATHAAEDNPVDAYLQNRATAPAAQNYGILTHEGKFSAEWKKAVGTENCNRLASAAALTDSHVRLVSEGKEDKEGKDTLRAGRSIDRLSVATNLIREGKATQKATVATNQQYLHFAYVKGVNLAVRLGTIEDLQSVFGLVSQDLGVNTQECKTAEDRLHLQLALLTVGFYAKNIELRRDIPSALETLTTEKDIVVNLCKTLKKETYNSFLNELNKKNSEEDGYNKKAAALYGDATQNFFEFAEDGTMLSAARPLFLRTAKKPFKVTAKKGQQNPILRVVELAKDKDKTKNGSIVPAVSAYLQKYFLIDTAEQAQNLMVLFAMASPKELSYADFVQWTQTGDLMNEDTESFKNTATAVQHVGSDTIKLTFKAAQKSSPSRDRLIDKGEGKEEVGKGKKPSEKDSSASKEKDKTPAKPAPKEKENKAKTPVKPASTDKEKDKASAKPKAGTSAKPAADEDDDEENDEEGDEEEDEEETE